MISISWLSLPADEMRRMTSHQASEDTLCRSGERLLSLAVVIGVSLAATLVALMSF